MYGQNRIMHMKCVASYETAVVPCVVFSMLTIACIELPEHFLRLSLLIWTSVISTLLVSSITFIDDKLVTSTSTMVDQFKGSSGELFLL